MKKLLIKTFVIATCVISTNLQAADNSYSLEQSDQTQEFLYTITRSDVHYEFNSNNLLNHDSFPFGAETYINEQVLSNELEVLSQQTQLNTSDFNLPTVNDTDHYYEARGRFFKSFFNADQYIPLSSSETNSKLNFSNQASNWFDDVKHSNNVDNSSVSWLDIDAEIHKVQSSSLGLVNTINIAPILSLFSITQEVID